jgi:hypothetical protein
MKVFQVKDATGVEPDCVYVIPPNKDMSSCMASFTSWNHLPAFTSSH